VCVSASHISPSLSNVALREVVMAIATLATSLLEIANYNVEVTDRILHCVLHADASFQGQQYVYAGELIPSKP